MASNISSQKLFFWLKKKVVGTDGIKKREVVPIEEKQFWVFSSFNRLIGMYDTVTEEKNTPRGLNEVLSSKASRIKRGNWKEYYFNACSWLVSGWNANCSSKQDRFNREVNLVWFTTHWPLHHFNDHSMLHWWSVYFLCSIFVTAFLLLLQPLFRKLASSPTASKASFLYFLLFLF